MSARTATRLAPWFAILAILLVSGSLRWPIMGVTPVLRDIERDLGLQSAVTGLITTVPVLFFALMAPVAWGIIRRRGPETAVFFFLGLVIAGTIIRSLPGVWSMMAGVSLVGAGIAIGNVVLPVIIRRDVAPEHVPMVTGAYAGVMNIGSLVVTFATVPLSEQVGWPIAVVSWVWIAVIGVVAWTLYWWRRRRLPDDDPFDDIPVSGSVAIAVIEDGSKSFRRVVMLLTALFAVQVFMFYGVSTWLPAVLVEDAGLTQQDAGVVTSLFQGAGALGAFLVPLIARSLSISIAAFVISASWIAFTAGLIFAPGASVFLAILGGIAHGGGFVVVFTLLVQSSHSEQQASIASATVQGGAYLLGAGSSPLLGAMHDWTHGWTAPLILLLGCAGGFSVVMWFAVQAARRR